jgi:divalent metal cation (Fe/Co/Zn/Cd) transporter
VITALLIAALVQSAAIDAQRDNYLTCLDTAVANATAQKIPATALEALLRQTCSDAETKFEGSLIAFDVKNKVARKQAVADAQLQVDDFISNLVRRYRAVTASK